MRLCAKLEYHSFWLFIMISDILWIVIFSCKIFWKSNVIVSSDYDLISSFATVILLYYSVRKAISSQVVCTWRISLTLDLQPPSFTSAGQPVSKIGSCPFVFTRPPFSSAPWVRAEDVTPCLLCSEAAFRNDEVYPLEWQSLRVLLMQGESIPPLHLHHPISPHDLTFTPRLVSASPRCARHVHHRYESSDWPSHSIV